MDQPLNLKEATLLELAFVAKSQPILKVFFGTDPAIPKQLTAEIFVSSLIPVLAMDGENPSIDDRMPFMHFLQNCRAGHLLIQFASFARSNRIKWARFSHSVRQPGFVFAWLSLCPVYPFQEDESVSDAVKRLRLDVGTPMDETTRWLAENARNSIPLPGTPEFEGFIAEQAKLLNANRRKAARGKAERVESIYKRIVSVDFLANALWCRSTSAIVSEYFPDSNADAHEKHERNFNKAFSELDLSKARRNDIPECPDIPG